MAPAALLTPHFSYDFKFIEGRKATHVSASQGNVPSIQCGVQSRLRPQNQLYFEAEISRTTSCMRAR